MNFELASKPDAKITASNCFSAKKFTRSFAPLVEKLYDASYFEAARSLRIRSILGVCEEFEDKADAKRAASDGFSAKKGPPAIVRGEPYVYSPRV